jgi:hypothetical protein
MVDMNAPFVYLVCSKTKCCPLHLVIMYVCAYYVITYFLPDTTSESKPQESTLRSRHSKCRKLSLWISPDL